MDFFLLLYEHFVMNRWWFHSDVKMFGLQSSDPSSLRLSHILSLPLSSPRLLFHPLIFPSGCPTSLQNKPACRHQIGQVFFLFFNPCVHLLLVCCQHLWALSISITGGRRGPHLVFGFKRNLLTSALLRISWNSLFVLDYALCAYFKIPPRPFVPW